MAFIAHPSEHRRLNTDVFTPAEGRRLVISRELAGRAIVLKSTAAPVALCPAVTPADTSGGGHGGDARPLLLAVGLRQCVPVGMIYHSVVVPGIPAAAANREMHDLCEQREEGRPG